MKNKRPTLDPTEHPRPHIDVPMSIFGEPLFQNNYALVGEFVHWWCFAVWKKDPSFSPAQWMTDRDVNVAVITGFLVEDSSRRGGYRLTGPNKDSRWLLDARKSWFTYAIEAVGQSLVKVGHTIDVDRRLDELQCSSPHHLEIIALKSGDLERLLHRRLRDHRVSGEWFVLNDETRRTILASLDPV